MPNQTTQQPSLCQHCAMSGICFSAQNNQPLIPKTRSHRVFHKAAALYSAGQAFDAIYVLRSGSAKSVILGNAGQEQITGFYYPGDLIGLDGFDDGAYAQSIQFLETSSVCRIGLGELDKAMANSPSIRYKLLQGMSHALNDEDRFLLSINNMTSLQRFVSFLLNLSTRFEKRGLSNSVFDLSMTRVDIANYLGMAIETISRLLTQLQNEAVIDVDKRRICILDINRLRQCVSNSAGLQPLYCQNQAEVKQPARVA